MALIQSVIEQGLIYAIMALGVYITYKILDFPDLTVDGSFPMGAAITAALISKGFNSLLTLPICFLAGCTHWSINRTDSCKIKSKRFTFRYYYDDSTLYRELKNCRKSKPADL